MCCMATVQKEGSVERTFLERPLRNVMMVARSAFDRESGPDLRNFAPDAVDGSRHQHREGLKLGRSRRAANGSSWLDSEMAAGRSKARLEYS